MNTKDIIELHELIVIQLEGEMTAEQLMRLNDKLKDKEQVRLYVECVSIFSELSCPSMSDVTLNQNMIDAVSDLGNPDSYMELLTILAESEKTAPAIEIPKEKPQRELIQKVVYPPREKRKISKFNLFTLITSAAAMLLMALFIKFAPEKQYSVEVATLVDQVNAKWGQSYTDLESDSRLSSGRLNLKEGFVQIVFNAGAKVLIEAPADFELLTDEQMVLSSGKLTAVVPAQAKGFIVQTPTASIVDYGTEFGVKVDEATNTTETHVFKGLVELRDNSDPSRFNTSKRLKAGMAASVRNGKISNACKTAPEQFATELPSDYEMAIRRSKPKAYWRLGESLTNLVGDDYFSGHIEGKVDSMDVMTMSGQKIKVLSVNPYQADGGVNYGNILDPGSGSLTVSIWFKPLSPQARERRQFIATKRDPFGNTGWSIIIQKEHFRLRTGTTDGQHAWLSTKNPVSTDWHHVVLVIDRRANILKGYLDGSSDRWELEKMIPYYADVKNVTNRLSYPHGAVIEDEDDFRIGYSQSDADLDILSGTENMTSNSFHGLIYDVAVWQRPLNGNEVRQLYTQCPLSDEK
ncbi:MAG: LamG-like jellyroll fold domain-containing protein [Planctomycetota bacterium]